MKLLHVALHLRNLETTEENATLALAGELETIAQLLRARAEHYPEDVQESLLHVANFTSTLRYATRWTDPEKLVER